MFEKVNPCHPDKVADRIAGAIVDLCYTKCKNPKVACEVLIGHGECTLQIETIERLTAEVLSPLWQGGGYKAGVEIKQAA